ncbi:DUF221 domain protein [Penicillium sp. IBT 35674x]|nr:DUF221 domain protein [Penicillium sp. IBT 35674x]
MSTLVPSLALFTVEMALFGILRHKQRRLYARRVSSGATSSSGPGLWAWILDLYRQDDAIVLRQHSLDAYFFLRYLKILRRISFGGCCITWVILLPTHITGSGHQTQLNLLSISNIAEDQYGRYYLHAFAALLLVGFVFAVITVEHIYFVRTRQQYVMSPSYRSRQSSRTVLFLDVPWRSLRLQDLQQAWEPLKVTRIWQIHDTRKLEEEIKNAGRVIRKLEAALIRLGRHVPLQSGAMEVGPSQLGHASSRRMINPGDAYAGHLRNRPTHRPWRIVGQKRDTIEWGIEKSREQSLNIQELKDANPDAAVAPSAFVEYATLSDAQSAYQCVTDCRPWSLEAESIGLESSQIIWKSLHLGHWQRMARQIAVTGLLCALIVFWALPTAIVGCVANIDYLATKMSFLSSLNSLPRWLRDSLSGLLPAVLMSLLVSVVPKIVRRMIRWQGATSLGAVELRTQHYSFTFQFVQVFLVVTISSTATSITASILDKHSSALALLAQLIPRASNFYLSFSILQGLSCSAGALLRPGDLIGKRVLGPLFDKTPRQRRERQSACVGLQWGTVYSDVTLLTTIGMIYSCIAPLLLGCTCGSLCLLEFAYRYDIFYVRRPAVDTQGMAYIQALQHLMLGCHFLLGCLIALFALATVSHRRAAGPLALMLALLAVTVLYHRMMKSAMTARIRFPGKNRPGAMGITPMSSGSGLPPLLRKVTCPPPRGLNLDLESSRRNSTEGTGYSHPALSAPAPTLLIPEELVAFSKQEIEKHQPASWSSMRTRR